MNKKELINFIKNDIINIKIDKSDHYESVEHSFFDGDFRDIASRISPKILQGTISGLIHDALRSANINYQIEEEYGGEGEGDQCWTVYSFEHQISKQKIYIKFYGSYESYNGTDYIGFAIVTPKTKVVIEYV